MPRSFGFWNWSPKAAAKRDACKTTKTLGTKKGTTAPIPFEKAVWRPRNFGNISVLDSRLCGLRPATLGASTHIPNRMFSWLYLRRPRLATIWAAVGKCRGLFVESADDVSSADTWFFFYFFGLVINLRGASAIWVIDRGWRLRGGTCLISFGSVETAILVAHKTRSEQRSPEPAVVHQLGCGRSGLGRSCAAARRRAELERHFGKNRKGKGCAHSS